MSQAIMQASLTKGIDPTLPSVGQGREDIGQGLGSQGKMQVRMDD